MQVLILIFCIVYLMVKFQDNVNDQKGWFCGNVKSGLFVNHNIYFYKNKNTLYIDFSDCRDEKKYEQLPFQNILEYQIIERNGNTSLNPNYITGKYNVKEKNTKILISIKWASQKTSLVELDSTGYEIFLKNAYNLKK